MTNPVSGGPPTDDGDWDVIVVGCGPVGAMLAILLGQKGHRVLVLDRYAHRYGKPRAVHFDDEIARLFAFAGVSTAGVADPAKTYEWRNAEGRTLLRFDYTDDGPSGWPCANMFGQPELEDVLGCRMAELATITLLRQRDVVDVAQDDTGAQALSRAADGSVHQARGRYLIGCDGANSIVRQQIDTVSHDLGFVYDWLIVDVILDEPRVFAPDNLQICDPSRPTTVVSGGPGRRRWEFMRLPGETEADLNDEDTAWRLLEPWSVNRSNARLERHALYTFQARWVQDWRDGRLLIAGDAAHLMPPFAGQGMCSGIRDAANLAWKLDLVLRAPAGDGALLDTYTPERCGHVQHAIATSIALGRVICATDLEAVAQRDTAMIAGDGDPQKVLPPVPPPTLRHGLLHGAHSGSVTLPAGALSMQAHVRIGDRTGRFDDLVGTGFVLATSADVQPVLTDHHRKALAALGTHIVRLVDRNADLPPAEGGMHIIAATDVDDRYLSFMSDAGVVAMVIRPDFYLFGGAPTVADVPELVEDLLTQLAQATAPMLATMSDAPQTVSGATNLERKSM